MILTQICVLLIIIALIVPYVVDTCPHRCDTCDMESEPSPCPFKEQSSNQDIFVVRFYNVLSQYISNIVSLPFALANSFKDTCSNVYQGVAPWFLTLFVSYYWFLVFIISPKPLRSRRYTPSTSSRFPYQQILYSVVLIYHALHMAYPLLQPMFSMQTPSHTMVPRLVLCIAMLPMQTPQHTSVPRLALHRLVLCGSNLLLYPPVIFKRHHH